MNWYLKVLKQYADFKGRARRKEYWTFAFINSIIKTVLKYTGVYLFDFDKNGIGIHTFYGFAIFIPYLAVMVRRAHDVGKSGWYMLIPFYNIYLLFIEGDSAENKYGPDSKNPNSELDQIGIKQA